MPFDGSAFDPAPPRRFPLGLATLLGILLWAALGFGLRWIGEF